MTKKTIAALFDDFETAVGAVRHLETSGLEPLEVSVITKDGTGHPAKDDAALGALVGAALGGGVGALVLGALVGAGLGPIAVTGWLAAILASAAAGGLVGALTRAGLTDEEAEAYAEGVRRGGTLVVVRTSEDNVERVVEILNEEGAVDMGERMAAWRDAGWTGGHPELP